MRRAAHGASTLPVSLNAPLPTRCELVQLAGVTPFRLRRRSHGPVARNDHASFFRASMQTGNNVTSPGLFASVFAGSHGEGMNQHLFTSRAALKLSQVADAVFDIAALVFITLFIILLLASPFIAAFCLALVDL